MPKCQHVLNAFKNKLEELMKNIKKFEILYNRYQNKKNNISQSIKELNEHYNLLQGAFVLSSNDKNNKIEENVANKNVIENDESSHIKLIDFKSCKTSTSLKINNLMNDWKEFNALSQEIISINNKIGNDKLSFEKNDCAIKDNVINVYDNLLKKISKHQVNFVDDNHEFKPEGIEEHGIEFLKKLFATHEEGDGHNHNVSIEDYEKYFGTIYLDATNKYEGLTVYNVLMFLFGIIGMLLLLVPIYNIIIKKID